MKYLSETMTREEAKKAYYKLAKTMHPDVGGDEDEFKILANEYAAIQSQSVKIEYQSFESYMERAKVMAEKMVDVLRDIYPGTNISLNYSYNSVDVAVYGNVPLAKMLRIEEILHSCGFPLKIALTFQRNGTRWYSLCSTGSNTLINIPELSQVDMTGAKEVYKGTRYHIEQNRYYAHGFDAKTGQNFYMKRTPKFTLRELMGL